MKMMLMILALSPVLALVGENSMPEDPFTAPAPKLSPAYLSISTIDLNADQSLQDAIQQIVAGLPPEARGKLIVDIPEAEIAKMRMKSDLRLRHVPLIIALKYLEQASPVGYFRRHGVYHISTERQSDVIAVEYSLSEKELDELGIVVGPNQMFQTKKRGTSPSGSGEWKVTYEAGVLRVLATRSFHDELEALLLLRARGYENLSMER